MTRWRQQSFGSYSIDPEPAQAEPQPPSAPVRQPAAVYAPAGAGQAAPIPELQGLGSRLRRTLPPLPQADMPVPPPQPADAGAATQQSSISNLLKQFRA